MSDDDRNALGLTAGESAEILAATSWGGEKGALAALVLEWPPAPIRAVARQAFHRNVGSGDARVQKAARMLERVLRRGPTDRSLWGGACACCASVSEEVRAEAAAAVQRLILLPEFSWGKT